MSSSASIDERITRIRQLDDKSDFALWVIRVRAAISAKGLNNVLSSEFQNKVDNAIRESNSTGEHISEDVRKAKDRLEQASNIIVAALSDQALRVVRNVAGKPFYMMEKLQKRYDSRSMASKIGKMSDLVSIRYTNIREDMARHVDKIAGIVEQLRSMGTVLEDSLIIGILLASIDVVQLHPATAAIKTLSETHTTWEDVSSRLIEEVKMLRSDRSLRHKSAAAVTKVCELCGKEGHTLPRCFLNPLNPNNRLGLSPETKARLDNKNPSASSGIERKSQGSDERPNRKNKARSAMAFVNNRDHKGKFMMLDSGTTSHMTPNKSTVKDLTDCSVQISLADASTVSAVTKGVRTVKWCTIDGPTTVNLSDTLILPEMSMSLLSVPALVNKNISVLFMPGKAILFFLTWKTIVEH